MPMWTVGPSDKHEEQFLKNLELAMGRRAASPRHRQCRHLHIYMAVASFCITTIGVALVLNALLNLSDLVLSLGDFGEAWFLQMPIVAAVSSASIFMNALAVLPGVITGKVRWATPVRAGVMATCAAQVVFSYLLLATGLAMKLLSAICGASVALDAQSVFVKLAGQGVVGKLMSDVDFTSYCASEGQASAGDHTFRLVIGSMMTAWSQVAILVCLTRVIFEAGYGCPQDDRSDVSEEEEPEKPQTRNWPAHDQREDSAAKEKSQTRMSRAGNVSWQPTQKPVLVPDVESGLADDPETSNAEKLIEELAKRSSVKKERRGSMTSKGSKGSASTRASTRASTLSTGSLCTGASTELPIRIAEEEDEFAGIPVFSGAITSPSSPRNVASRTDGTLNGSASSVNPQAQRQSISPERADQKASDTESSSGSSSASSSDSERPAPLMPRLALGRLLAPPDAHVGGTATSSSTTPRKQQSVSPTVSPRHTPRSSPPPSSRVGSSFSGVERSTRQREPGTSCRVEADDVSERRSSANAARSEIRKSAQCKDTHSMDGSEGMSDRQVDEVVASRRTKEASSASNSEKGRLHAKTGGERRTSSTRHERADLERKTGVRTDGVTSSSRRKSSEAEKQDDSIKRADDSGRHSERGSSLKSDADNVSSGRRDSTKRESKESEQRSSTRARTDRSSRKEDERRRSQPDTKGEHRELDRGVREGESLHASRSEKGERDRHRRTSQEEQRNRDRVEREPEISRASKSEKRDRHDDDGHRQQNGRERDRDRETPSLRSGTKWPASERTDRDRRNHDRDLAPARNRRDEPSPDRSDSEQRHLRSSHVEHVRDRERGSLRDGTAEPRRSSQDTAPDKRSRRTSASQPPRPRNQDASNNSPAAHTRHASCERRRHSSERSVDSDVQRPTTSKARQERSTIVL